MKVAFLIEHLDARRGGMERSSLEFLAETVARGVEITVVTQSAAPEFSLAPVHRLGTIGLGRRARYDNFVRNADMFLATSTWDVVHSVTPCLNCDLFQPRGGLVQEAINRTIATRRHWITQTLRRFGARLNGKYRLLLQLEKQLLTRKPPPLFAPLSRYVSRQAREIYSVPGECVREVFNGVTVSLPAESERRLIRERLRSELAIDQRALVAIFVAHNFRLKGLTHLIEALAEPNAASWQLLVAGKDSPRPCEHLARKFGVAARVHFLGRRSDVRDLSLASDAGVLPTYYDPCSRAVLEGLSLGLPYITTAFNGASDCLKNGENGFVIESPDSVGALAQALAALADANLRRKMSDNALTLRPFLSMRRHAEQIVALYEQIAARKGKAKSC